MFERSAGFAPLAVTQDNCLAALGIEPRRFLALIHEREIPHVKLGKLRLVRADVLFAALETAPAKEAERAPEAQPETTSSRLARAAGLQ